MSALNNESAPLDWITAQGLDLHLQGDGAFPDLEGRLLRRGHQMPAVVRLPDGTTQGRSVVIVRIDLPETTVCLEMTARAFIMAAQAVRRACEASGESDLP